MPNAAKRRNNLAQGFNPGFDVFMRCALERAPDAGPER